MVDRIAVAVSIPARKRLYFADLSADAERGARDQHASQRRSPIHKMVLERRNDVHPNQGDSPVCNIEMDVDGEVAGFRRYIDERSTSKSPNMSIPAPSEVEIR